MKTSNQFFYAVLLICVGMSANIAAAGDYPLRAKYPNVKVVSTEDLAKNFGDYIVVDVRSKMEYDVAHVNNAKHVNLSKESFLSDLGKVRPKNGNKPIAFYCNGHTCAKSYKASAKAAGGGFANVYCYDSGIFDWIKANPDKATLMGQTPAPADKIISKSDLKKRMISFGDFKARASQGNAMAIDIRDPFQRKVIPEVANLKNVPLDDLLGRLKNKEYQDKDLLILDAVGKQVRWLQYHLEDNGYTNYSFLDKGVGGIK